MIVLLNKLRKKSPSKKNILIFDFDGTVADTLYHLISISNRLSKKFGYKEINLEDVENMRDWTSQQVFKHLKVPYLKIPYILKCAREEMQKDYTNIKIFSEIKETLIEIRNRDYEIGIFTSNSHTNVVNILKQNQLNIFDFILTTPKLWNKNRGLKRIIRQRNIIKDTVIYIGDETRDIQAAKKVGVKSMAVGWGYNSIKKLKSLNPDYIAFTPHDILQYCPKKTNNE